ncbi:MAG TPA: hypothetical protein VGK30_16780 [Candidatus Binatia bacterium]
MHAAIGATRGILMLMCVLVVGCSDPLRDAIQTAAQPVDGAPAEAVASPHAAPSVMAPAPLPPPEGLPTMPPPESNPKFQPKADAPGEEPISS